MSQAGVLNLNDVPPAPGFIVQQVRAKVQGSTFTVANFGTSNSVPLITGGTQLFSLSITPTSALHVLVFECFVPVSSDGSSSIIALFQNPTANALASCITTLGGQLSLGYFQPAGGVGAITFSIRYGTPSDGPGTMYVNDTSLGAANLGNNVCSLFTITEYTS